MTEATINKIAFELLEKSDETQQAMAKAHRSRNHREAFHQAQAAEQGARDLLQLLPRDDQRLINRRFSELARMQMEARSRSKGRA